MSTKVIVVGTGVYESVQQKIKFISCLTPSLTKSGGDVTTPAAWKNVELICKNYRLSGSDLMYAYGSDRDEGVLYFGQFNDGVV